MIFTIIFKGIEDTSRLERELNSNIDSLMRGNIFNWDMVNIIFNKVYKIPIYKKTTSGEKSTILPDGTTQYYIETATTYYTQDETQKDLQVAEIEFLNPTMFGYKNNFSNTDRNKIRSFMSNLTYSLYQFEGQKTKNQIITDLTSQGYINTRIETTVTREVKPVKTVKTDPETGEKKESISYETISYTKPSQVATSTTNTSDFISKYDLWLGLAVILLILFIKK
ncbi:MAG: hypothetical protein IE890_00870 [Arcobacter sp.]|nr:hypothetical protein [Arcobacter sp.]